ncbi:MAG TPA: lipoyl synthase [Syntrophorhabdaceae bacterium]|nr:lipoyl synthase [Syntrophorhabdaceae bacterium]HPA07213.1 lipoyl synthase [Methanoregulaceae archaeon]
MRTIKHPDWLKVPAPSEKTMGRVKRLLDRGGLHTVCEGANCPNIGECFASRTCTFMILGNICTRDCRFCAVEHGRPEPINLEEPEAIALMAKQLHLKHVVITTVTRDDLPDGGAGQFVAVIGAIHRELPQASIEVLISDLKGQLEPLVEIMHAGPDIINHNVETVPRLYKAVRPQASYARSLQILDWVSREGVGITSKSGLMLGLGETFEEIVDVLRDLRKAGCEIVTLGQYLSPSPEHVPVERFVHPDEFKKLEAIGEEMGFLAVNAGPLVRSSYNAAHTYERILQKQTKEE